MELPEYFVAGYHPVGADQLSPEKRHGDQKSGESFAIDDLLDFSNADAVVSDGFLDNAAGKFTDSSTITAVDSSNSSISGGDNHFPANIVSCDDPSFSEELCVPYEAMEELEWLSSFVEESFQDEDELKTLHLISGVKPQTPESSASSDTPNAPFSYSAKARSKRSHAAPRDWFTRFLNINKPAAAEPKPVQAKRRDGFNLASSGRKCLHCGVEKTPQWRAGPVGPKTLCSACGVRFKSGRLVPEYRPAASPTFVSTKHSNSHRKVLELRRQKELLQQQHLLSQSSIFGVSNGEDAFLVHHQSVQDHRHII